MPWSRRRDRHAVLLQALAINEANLQAESPDHSATLNNLAVVYGRTHRSEAEPLLRGALAIDERYLDRFIRQLPFGWLTSVTFLGMAARLDEAEPLLARALEIDEAIYGLAHPAVANDLNSLGALRMFANRLSEAKDFLRRALKIDEARLGQTHPDIASVLTNLAGISLVEGDLNDAENLMRRALVILVANTNEIGREHIELSQAMTQL